MTSSRRIDTNTTSLTWGKSRRVVSTILGPGRGPDAVTVTSKYAGLFLKTNGLNIWPFSDMTTRDKYTFNICSRINFEVRNKLQVLETDGKDIFDAKSPISVC